MEFLERIIGFLGEGKKKPERPKTPERPPEIIVRSFCRKGRAGQDGIATTEKVEPNQLPIISKLYNEAGITFVGGVFDGHGGGGEIGQYIAETALNTFLQHLCEYLGYGLDSAILYASASTDQELSSLLPSNTGVCFEMAIAARDGLYVVHLGDGEAYKGRKRGKIRLLTTPHKALPGSKASKYINVSRSWGDRDIKEGGGELSPYPDVIKIPWKELRGASLLLMSDGLPDAAAVTGTSLKKLIKLAIREGLGPIFQARVGGLMAQWNQMFQQGRAPAPADDASVLLLECK